MDTQYSYTEDGGREFLENKPFLEPFVQAAAMGAVTSKLELTSNVVKLPVRPPLYSAKMAASIAALTNNRFNFGVGLSVWAGISSFTASSTICRRSNSTRIRQTYGLEHDWKGKSS
jgi:hypothetical protein